MNIATIQFTFSELKTILLSMRREIKLAESKRIQNRKKYGKEFVPTFGHKDHNGDKIRACKYIVDAILVQVPEFKEWYHADLQVHASTLNTNRNMKG